MKFRKATVIIATMLIAVFMTTSAMAYVLNSRSEEMTANSYCDFAGTITLTFVESDYDTIQGYLATNDYVLIRVSLSGTDFAAGSDVPLLCKDIEGSADAANYAGDVTVPNDTDVVALQTIGVEVSDVTDATGSGAGADATPDVMAYVYGQTGDQYLEIYVTDIQPAGDWSNENERPWIKVGLYDELIDAGDLQDTAICADVHDFDGLSKLTVSIDNTPSSLSTTTSDNQIGHFLVEDMELRDCAKGEICDAIDTSIELCDIELENEGQSGTCDVYDYCFVAEGDFATEGNMSLVMRTNGATDGAATQSGIYFRSVKVFSGSTIIRNSENSADDSYFDWETASGVNTSDPTDCWVSGGAIYFPNAEKVTVTVPNTSIGSNGLRVCIEYLVNPDEAEVDTYVRFWTVGEVLPCGNLWTETRQAARLVECGGTPTCVYMPYVVTQSSPWVTGIAVTNLSPDVAAADMEVTFTLTDATGAQFTYTKDDFDSVVWGSYLDSMLSNFSGTPAPGVAWLLIQGNFEVDAYTYLTNGVFGGCTLARPIEDCDTVAPDRD